MRGVGVSGLDIKVTGHRDSVLWSVGSGVHLKP